MPLAGRQLSLRWALALGYYAGWRRKDLYTAVAIMTAESARYVEAWHENPDGSTDRGLFQINDKSHPNVSDSEAYNAVDNTMYAYHLSEDGERWSPWAAYNSGAYTRYLPESFAAWSQGWWWKRLVPQVPTELGLKH